MVQAIQRRWKRRKEWIFSPLFRQDTRSLNLWPLVMWGLYTFTCYLMQRNCEKRVDSSLPQTLLGVTLMQKSPSSHLCLALQHLWAPQPVQWVDKGRMEVWWRSLAALVIRQLQEPLGQPPGHPSKLFPRALGGVKTCAWRSTGTEETRQKGSSRINVINPGTSATTVRGRVASVKVIEREKLKQHSDTSHLQCWKISDSFVSFKWWCKLKGMESFTSLH